MELSFMQIIVLLIESIGIFLVDRKILFYYTLLALVTVMIFFFL